jgi:Flp pilus assembly protein TadG
VTIVADAIILMMLSLALGAADVARVLLASARAQTAADASALAAAQELALPSGLDPGAVARAYAERNGAELVECRCATGSVEAIVTAHVAVGPLVLASDDRSVAARARAVVERP